MKEYKIWKFIPGKYLQTVTVSLETEHVCFVKANLSFEERENLKCTASRNKEHKNFIHIRLLHRIFIDE